MPYRPVEVRAGAVAMVSADGVVAVVRAYADRVHDAVRRTGCDPQTAVELVARSAADMVTALLAQPETVGDLAGWWFAQAEALALRHCAGAVEHRPAPSIGLGHEERLLAALGRLEPADRRALRLRDAYGLPTRSLAVGLGLPAPVAVDRVAAARVRLLTAYDGRPVPDASAHRDPPPAGLAQLGALADNSLAAAQASALRGHLGRCPPCEEAVDAQARAHRLVAGLPRWPLPDSERERLVTAVATAADDLGGLAGRLFGDTEATDRPPVPPLLVAAAVALALVAGVVVGLRGPGSAPAAPRPGPSVSARP